jgi:hypothetical protein
VDIADLVRAGAARGAGAGRAGTAVIRRWLAAPPLHFVVLGALLFALETSLASRDTADVVAKRALSDEELFEREARRLGLERRDAVIQRRLLRNLSFVGEAGGGGETADFEEALALGLAESDLVVRRRLVQRIELEAEAWARASEPSEAELASRLARESERFALPARVRIVQAFSSRDRRGAALAAADRALAARLRGVPPAQASRLGDPFLWGGDQPALCERELAARFGAPFARAVFALEPGRWSEAIASSFGLHRVYVLERTPARMPELAEVRGALRELIFAERAAAVREDWLRRLRAEEG